MTFIYLPNEIKAQGEANNWYFGQNAGLSFNGGATPVALFDGELNTLEGSASISDANGQLLFYTDGTTVWNRNHDTLQNGFGLLGEQSSTQAALIIPKPGSNNIYYIFTTAQAQRFEDWNFCYTEVDMNLDAGLGGVTTNKNVILFEPIAEKITAVKHANGSDIWVITHDKFTNKYLTYSVTNGGVNLTPIVFEGGSVDNGVENLGIVYNSPNFGYLKASPDGSKIACAFSKVNKVDVLDFNNATGQLTLRFTINQIATPYGIEFSPNSSLLYVSGYTNYDLKQYNLNLATPAAIISSSVQLSSSFFFVPWALQRGPDERIYIANGFDNSLGCIRNPDAVGLSCDLNLNEISLGTGTSILGLPNFFPYFTSPSGILHTGNCQNSSIAFTFSLAQQADSVLWDFGDPFSGLLNFSISISPFHSYSSAGNFLVTVTTYLNGIANVSTKYVSITPVPDIHLGPDFAFCNGSAGQINVLNAQLGYSYNWTADFGSFSTTEPSLSIVNQGMYIVSATNLCGTDQDTVFAFKVDLPEFDFGEDFSICEGSQVFLNVNNQALATYLWQDGSTEMVYPAANAGLYSLQLTNACGTASDSVFISMNSLPVIFLNNDTALCEGQNLTLTPTGIFDFYYWDNGSLNEPLDITQTGTYTAFASNSCGLVSRSINVQFILPPIALELDSIYILCGSSQLQLNVEQANVSYLWQDGSSNPEFNVTESGTYAVTLNNQCGATSDTTVVIVTPIPSVSLGPDVTSCNGNPIELTATGNTNDYFWFNGISNPTITVNSSGIYSVSASNNCGLASDTIVVTVGAATEKTISINQCEPFTINGITYSNSGTYIQTLINNQGCDSILTINAEILNFTAQITQQGSTLIFNGNPSSIQWINCTTGQAIPGATQTSFTPQVSGNYGAVITIGECVDTSNCLQFIKQVEIQFPSICETIVLSPNPVIDNLQFNLNKNSYPVNLFSSTGALVKSWTGNDQTQMVFFSELATAVYILQIDSCYFKVVKN